MGKKNRNRIDTGRAIAGPPAGRLPPSFRPETIEAAAIAAHEANRRYCESIGDSSQVTWDAAPEWQKQSAINGVQFAIDNGFPSPQAMHDNWMAEKIRAGWKYGEVKDAEKLTHPCIVPYSELPEAQRKKDDIFREAIMTVLGVPLGQAFDADPNAATEEDILDLDNPEDGDEGNPGPAIFEHEWNLCLSLAFSGTGLDMLTNWGSIPFELWRFISANKDAPDEAVLIHIRRSLKVAILPNEDQRRVHLAIQLFRHMLIAMQKIETEDADAAQLAELQKIAAGQVVRIDLEDQAFAQEAGPFDQLSDLGKSLSRKAD